MRRIKIKHRGSSILMVLLIVSSVLVVVFAAQRISLVQFSQSAREEDNLIAYYAAKAGIEDGLARFRFNRNTETTANKSFRYNLTNANTPNTGDTSYEVNSNEDLSVSFSQLSNNYDPEQQYYDLQMEYLENRNGFTGNDPNWSEAKKIEKDGSATLTGFTNTGNNPPAYYLRHVIKFLEPGTTSKCTNTSAFVQLEQFQEGISTNLLAQTQVRLGSDPDGIIDSRDTGSNWQIKNGVELTVSLRLRPYFCDIQFAVVNSGSTNGFGKENSTIPDIDSLTTVITATGYYGASKRTLVAEVDRVSGTLIGIYDYNLFAGGGSISR